MLKLASWKIEYRTILQVVRSSKVTQAWRALSADTQWILGGWGVATILDKTLDEIAYLENIVTVAVLPSPPPPGSSVVVSKKKA